jgi:FAD/FMN-containing dehydrogenase
LEETVTELLQTLLNRLREQISGQVLLPEDEGYSQARTIWNGMIDKYPAVFVQCQNSQDVVAALAYAQTSSMPISIRSGGHNVTGCSLCENGLVIDLSQMKKISIDPVSRTAIVEPGLTIGEVINETQKYGLGLTIGTVSGTGIAGLTLGGGMGWLMGKYGLTADHLLAAEIVTADGQILSVNEKEHADLFWAIRGGGGNFGVVTSFTFRLHPLGLVYAGVLLYPLSKAKTFLRYYQTFSSLAPDELTAYAAFINPPGQEPAIGIAFCYCGEDLSVGEELLEPLRNSFGTPLVDTVRHMPYTDTSIMLDAGAPDGWRYYEKGGTFQLNEETIDILIEHASARTSPLTQVMIQHVHGAVCRVDPTATPIDGLRREKDCYNLLIVATWKEDTTDELHRKWARFFWQAISPHALGGGYTNFLGSDTPPERIRAAYGANYQRLVALKKRYDPQQRFHSIAHFLPTDL